MVNRNEWVDDLQKNISDLIGRSPAADIERNVRAFMTQTFSRLDLVTREEFDIQAQLLEKALHRITALESRLNQLEGRHPPASVPPEGARQAGPMSAAMRTPPPMEPAASAGPASPVEPASPIQSASSAGATTPVETVTPADPAAPAQPASSIELPPSAKRRDLG